MTSSFSLQTAAVGSDLPWNSSEDERVRKSPSGRRRQRQSSPWSANCGSSYRYATHSFVGDLLAHSSKITMLHKTHKEIFSKKTSLAHGGETFLVQDSHNPFLLMKNVSDRLLQENDEDNFYHAIRSNYSSSNNYKRKIQHRPSKDLDNRNPNTSKHLLATFYRRHVRQTTINTDLTQLSDHLCFDDGDDKVYNYNMRSSSSLLASSSSAHPLLRPSLLQFRNQKKRPLSKGRNCHRRGSTTSCSTLSSFESFSSFPHPNESSSPSSADNDKRSASVLGSSLRILMQTNHHPKLAPTSVVVAANLENIIILNIEERFRDMDITGNTAGEQVNTDKTKPPTAETKAHPPRTNTEEKATTDYSRSETSLDFCLLEKPRNTKKRLDHDDTPLSIFQPSVSSTQAESSSGLMFLFDSNTPGV